MTDDETLLDLTAISLILSVASARDPGLSKQVFERLSEMKSRARSPADAAKLIDLGLKVELIIGRPAPGSS